MKLLKKISKTIFPAFLLSLALAQNTFAQGIKNANNSLTVVKDKSGVTEGSLSEIVGTGINAALSLVGLIFMVLTVYAGILWMTARGESGQVDTARTILSSALIGLILTVAAFAISVFVTSAFGAGA